MKDYARSFYGGKAWKSTQAAYMVSQRYICERCGSVARVVHHKKHITPANISDPAITLDWGNLEALCMDCHNSEHGAGPVCAEGLRFDGAGNLIKECGYG
jgi:5-methylcytosine-specific restriction endonuclease McrA